MQTKTELSFFTLLLMISFASVNAVLFTPALPSITHFFAVSTNIGQLSITCFLVGYAIGQLIYGPIANRYGRKPALYVGIIMQILSGLICVSAGFFHEYYLLVIGRFIMALGSGVGLKMTITLLNECYEPKIVSQKISYLMLAFAITPGIAIALGGILTTHFGWMSCFYVSIIYGMILLLLIRRLPETLTVKDFNALNAKHILQEYRLQFKNLQLITCSLLMGSSTSFIYIFAASAPFIAINLLGMSSSEYGVANLLPAIGLLMGSIASAKFPQKYLPKRGIQLGILLISISSIYMMIAVITQANAIVALFLPMTLSYFGLTFIFANTSTIAMSNVSDKSHGSAVMNFINIGIPTFVVILLGMFKMSEILLPMVYIFVAIGMIGLSKLIFN